eukprot:6209935-Pleurochrysis_carterae.AAC.3
MLRTAWMRPQICGPCILGCPTPVVVKYDYELSGYIRTSPLFKFWACCHDTCASARLGVSALAEGKRPTTTAELELEAFALWGWKPHAVRRGHRYYCSIRTIPCLAKRMQFRIAFSQSQGSLRRKGESKAEALACVGVFRRNKEKTGGRDSAGGACARASVATVNAHPAGKLLNVRCAT